MHCERSEADTQAELKQGHRADLVGKSLREPCSHGPGCQRKERSEE